MKRNIALCALAVVFVAQTGCGKKNDGNTPATSNGTSQDNTKKVQTPEERWPGIGVYGYTYSDSSMNCDTKQHSPINRQIDFCQTVVDSQVNNDCALKERKAEYDKKCGDDFEATNVFARQFSGYDDNLRGICQTALPPAPRFAKNSDYCAFLKDETLHKGCLSDVRALEFQRALCQGAF